MVSERDRILKLKEYLNSLGIEVNIGKTKARGNKGIFIGKKNDFRIDISKELPEDKILPVIIHEFVHYVHYLYDNTLKSLSFVFDEITNELEEELINITVRQIPKDFAASLYEKKNILNSEIKHLASSIKNYYPDFKLSERCKPLERNLGSPIKYLLKYDRVKIFNKIYSIHDIADFDNISETQQKYIILKSKQRALSRINSKISRLNKYYNNPSELLARFCELYFLDEQASCTLAPTAVMQFKQSLERKKVPEFYRLAKMMSKF